MYSNPMLTNLRETIPQEIVYKWRNVVGMLEQNNFSDIKIEQQKLEVSNISVVDLSGMIGGPNNLGTLLAIDIGGVRIRTITHNNAVRGISTYLKDNPEMKETFGDIAIGILRDRPNLIKKFTDQMRISEL